MYTITAKVVGFIANQLVLHFADAPAFSTNWNSRSERNANRFYPQRRRNLLSVDSQELQFLLSIVTARPSRSNSK